MTVSWDQPRMAYDMLLGGDRLKPPLEIRPILLGPPPGSSYLPSA